MNKREKIFLGPRESLVLLPMDKSNIGQIIAWQERAGPYRHGAGYYSPLRGHFWRRIPGTSVFSRAVPGHRHFWSKP